MNIKKLASEPPLGAYLPCDMKQELRSETQHHNNQFTEHTPLGFTPDMSAPFPNENDKVRNRIEVYSSMVITQRSRVYWDFFAMLVLVMCAFETPFDIFVGWSDPTIGDRFNTFFTVVFVIDIFLNCLTAHQERYSGLWGWRKIAGLFSNKLSCEYLREHDETVDELISEQPRVAFSYLTSGWFLIDFIAVFPFDLFFAGVAGTQIVRTVRLGRFFRVLRLLRVMKSIRLIEMLRVYFAKRPAVARTLLIMLGVCFLAHLHACLFYFFENTANKGIDTYQEAIYSVYLAFATSYHERTFTTQGFVVSISAVISGLLFFGLLVGNFSSYFEELDRETADFGATIAKWNNLFSAFPAVFDSKLRSKIIQIEKDRFYSQAKIQNYATLIHSLDQKMEQRIAEKISALNQRSPTPERELLLRYLLVECDNQDI